MKKLLILIVLSALILSSCSNSALDSGALGSEDATPVIVTDSEVQVIQDTFIGIGKIEAGTVLNVMTGSSGDVKDVFVKIGDQVQVGDLLFELDKGNLESSLSTTESQLRTRRESLVTQVSDAQSNYDNKKQLYATGGLSQVELENLESQLKTLKQQLADANTAYTNQVGDLKDAIGDRQVKSPMQGEIASVSIQKSDRVQNVVALQIVDDSTMQVKSFVTGELLDNLSIDGQVLIYPDGDKTLGLKGQIVTLNRTASDQTGLYEVTVLLLETNRHVRNGAYAELDFITNEREALLIPKKAVVKNGEIQLVYVLEGDRVVSKDVELGLSEGNRVEVLAGLKVRDQIILEGQAYLKDGSLVQVIEEK